MAGRWEWILTGAALAAAYLVLAGTVGAWELIAAFVCASAAVIWAAAVVACSPKPLRPPPSSAVAIVHALSTLPAKTFAVAWALTTFKRGEEGRTQTSFLAPGDDDGPRSAGCHAMEVLTSSIAPDSFVVRVTDNRNARLDHVLVGLRTPGGEQL